MLGQNRVLSTVFYVNVVNPKEMTPRHQKRSAGHGLRLGLDPCPIRGGRKAAPVVSDKVKIRKDPSPMNADGHT
jgi:hypothetical protein